MNIRVLHGGAVVFFGSMSGAVAFTIEVLRIGSHLTNDAQPGTINVNRTNDRSLNFLDLSTFDVVYANEHAGLAHDAGTSPLTYLRGALAKLALLQLFSIHRRSLI